MFDKASVQTDETDSQQRRRAQVIALLGPLISLFTVILARSADFGLIAWIPLIVIAAYSVYAVLGHPSQLAVRKIVKMVREHHLVPQYFSQLDIFIKRLKRLCDQCYCDNVAHVLRDVPQLWGGQQADSPVLGHVAGFADALGLMLSQSRRNKKDLVLLVRWFSLVLNMYNRQCICEPARQAVIRLEQGLDEDKKRQYERLKREYHTVRLGYVMFLEQYGQFTRDLNSAFGENIACDYFDRPPEL